MKKKLFMFVFVLAAVFDVNDIYQASSQMQQFTLDIPAMKGTYTSSKIAKNQFTNQNIGLIQHLIQIMVLNIIY